jgi:hypothetical protein
MYRKGSLGDSLSSVLPNNLSALFVDNDTLLRKFFSRSIRDLMPSWNLQEVGNERETSLRPVLGTDYGSGAPIQEGHIADLRTISERHGEVVSAKWCKPFLDHG